MSPRKSPFFELRSGAVDTLLFVIKTTDLEQIRAELTRRFEATPEFFANDVVAIDVRRLAHNERVPLADIAGLLDSVRMRPIGVVADAVQLSWVSEGGLPLLEARDHRANQKTTGEVGESAPDAAAGSAAVSPQSAAASSSAASASSGPASATSANSSMSSASATAATPATAATSATPSAAHDAQTAASQPAEPVRTGTSSQTMVVDKPLRSGQRIYAKGDLVVLGMVNHGAEVIAEGNIHIYAPLRGRALAGVHGNHDARIFCTCLEPELISIAGIYRTTENPLPPDVLGKAVQIWLDEDEKLLIEPLRLT
jgi:septum site-determining protein MinC